MSRRFRSIPLTLATATLALVATACPTDPPAPSPYRAELLSPGNRIFVTTSPAGVGKILSNPGGTSDFPADPVTALDLYFDATGLGNPANADRLGRVDHPDGTVSTGIYDGNGVLRIDFGPQTSGYRFSADGSTFGITRWDNTGAYVDIYNAIDLTLRRSFAWPLGTGLPTIQDFSRDGSRLIVRGYKLWSMSEDYALFTATTTGSDPLAIAVPVTGEAKYAYRLTDAGRIVYSVYRGLLRPAFELRTVGVDGLGERSLGLFDSYTGYPETAGEIGGARVLVEMLVPGTLDRTEIVAVEDSPTATRTVIAGPLDGNSQRFSRLVLAPD